MRLFVVLRSVFFLSLLTASLVFVTHTQLCIDYAPRRIDEFVKDCKEVYNSIKEIENESRVKRATSEQEALLNALNGTLIGDEMDVENQTMIVENITIIGTTDRGVVIDRPSLSEDHIRINAKTCFDFTISEIVSGSTPKYSKIVGPLRLTLILIVTSFLVAILDLSARLLMRQLSVIQCLIHSFVQIALWGSILVNMEMYRRGWMSNWSESGQASNEIPMYPGEWTHFEIYSFIIMLLSVLESVLFEHLAKNIKLVASQGVYKCIEQDVS